MVWPRWNKEKKVWYYNATYRLEMQAKPLEKVTLKVKHLSCYWQIGSMQLCCLVRPTFIFLIVSNVICGDITKEIGVLTAQVMTTTAAKLDGNFKKAMILSISPAPSWDVQNEFICMCLAAKPAHSTLL